MLAAPVAAQSPDWSSVLTISPTPSPYLADWERVPSTALLSLTYTGTQAADFRVRVTLNNTQRGLIGTTESPTVTLAGGPTSFLYNVRDVVFEWTTVSRNSAVTDAALKTGQLPEGEYQACARVFVGLAVTPVTESCAEFSVLQPDPPQLLAPQDEESVVSTQPFFQWTPVLAPPSIPVSYEVTVVELIGSQVPSVALDANIPVLRTVVSTPFLIYPIDALPLERTKRYVWQVRAVDDAGRQLFRDGVQSEIWTFAMADDLLQPIEKLGRLPDEVTLWPGVARLVGLRGTRTTRSATELMVDGTVTLEFLGSAFAGKQEVQARGLRLGIRGGSELSVLDGTLEAVVPRAMVPTTVSDLVVFGPLVFTPKDGFTATASLRIPGQAPLPLAGTVQLTANGLFGRLDGAGQGGLPFARIGRAPVQYAPTSARLTLPDGRLEFAGQVRIFEQEVGCPASGTMENGVVQLPVYCDPTRGFRPDTSSSRSLLTFGTISGSLAADFLTDTLGTALRAPATFSVFGDRNEACVLRFSMLLTREGMKREDEQQSCSVDESRVDLGWLRLALSNLRIERLEYAPGATLSWRALVDVLPSVRAADNLQLPTIRDVQLDQTGVFLPSLASDQPGSATSGYVELQQVGVLPRSMGFRGGLLKYRDWLSGTDPGLEWGSGASWISFPSIGPASSSCLNTMPFEVDTLVIKAGRIDVALQEKRWEGDGCKLYAAENLHVMLQRVSGRVAFTVDSTSAFLAELPTVAGEAVDHRVDCGIPVIGCILGRGRAALTGDIRLTPRGRLRGTATGFAAGWQEFNLRFAKLQTAGGALVLGVDTAGVQTAIYDGSVKVDFSRISEKADTATKKDTSAVGTATATATSAGTSLLSSGTDTVRAIAKLDWVAQRFLGGRIVLKGPFPVELGFIKFIVGEATLDTLGFHVDGRHRVVVSKVTAKPKAEGSRDSTYTTADDTVGVTFAGVRLDPSTGDVVAGTISFDGNLALESSPLSSAITLGAAAIGGAITGGGDGALTAMGQTVSGTNILGFKLVQAASPFDKTVSTGNIRLQLPSTPTIDATGMRINGVAPARAAFAGSTYDSASVSFENGFALRPGQGRVSAGRALVRVRQYPIAFLEPAGWRVALAELVQTVIPDTLKLFDEFTAYVVLRDSSKQLLVDVTDTEEGPRIRTRAGTPVQIVIPALKGSRTSAPRAEIAMDLTLERGTWKPLAGDLVARGTGAAADDFSIPDFPFVLDSVALRATRGAETRFMAHGRIDAWSGAHEPMRVALGFGSAGSLSADVRQVFSDSLPLVDGSSLFRFHIDTLHFTAQGKLGADFQWRLDLPGRLGYRGAEGGAEQTLASATMRISPVEAALLNFVSRDSLTTVELPGVNLRLGRVRAPTFRWDFAQRKFDFELLFDVAISLPDLDSLSLPEIRDIRVTPQGLTIPSFEMSSFPTVADPDDPFAPRTSELRLAGFHLKPLAFRVSEFRWNWFAGAPPPQFNFGVDLEMGVDQLPSAVEGVGARITLRALNVGVTDGAITGRFEPIEIPTPIRTPVADIRGAFGSFRVAEGQAPDVQIGVIADLRLPDVMACGDAADRMIAMTPGADTLFLASNGTLRGSMRNILPRCPLALGPFGITFGTSTVRFGYDATRQRVDVALDAAATLRVQGDSPNETVSATGRLSIDIDEGKVLDAAIAIDEPFYWAPDSANPFLKLIVSEASLTQTELRFGATGQLRTAEGAGVDVAFENVAFDLQRLTLKSGRIRLTADAAVGIELPENGSLLFGVYPVTTPRGGTASARIVLPQGALIDSAGLHISGTATASLAFGGEEYAALAGEFANDFTIATAGRVAIARGRINLRDGAGQLIAYADSVGFWPGNVFAVLPVPARLGVPSADVAYLQLRDPTDTTRLLIETEFGAETVRLRTRPNEKVSLVLPALVRNGTTPTIQTEFDLVLNARTMKPVSGGLTVRAADGQSLIPLEGLPVALTQLGFAADTGGFRLRAGARAKLPGPLSTVDLEFRDLEVTAQGLTGVIELGQYSETFDPTLTPIAEARLLGDTLAITFTGAELTLQPNANVVKLSGGIRSVLLKPESGPARVIHLAAQIDNNGFRGTADLSDAETPIPIGVAELTLENGASKPGLAVTANDQEFAIVLGGSVRLPTIAPGFSLGVEDFKVGSAGVSIPNVSVTAPANTKEFELFGARFALRDSVAGGTQVAPAIGIALNRGVVQFTLSGYVTLLKNTTRFIGLRFATDGQFGLQGADFISKPIVIVEKVASLTRVAIADNKLVLSGAVQLPQPFAQGVPSEVTVRIAADGTVSGGGKVVIINEPDGLATAQTKLSLGVAAFHLRYLDLAIDFANEANTAVSMVADVYIQEKQANVLRIGKVVGGTVTPGLRVAINGNVTWAGFDMPNPITLDFDPVKLTFSNVTATGTPDGGFAVSLSGALGLMLDGSGGELKFRNVGFTSAGEVRIGQAAFDGGTFTIQNTVKIVVGQIAWGDADTSIFVPVARPPGPNGDIQRDSTLAPVSSFLSIGASIDIAGTFSGGVDRVLVYVRSDDSTTHFLIENLKVEIPGVIQFTANMSYDELPDGFDMQLATEGTLLNQFSIGLVGVMGRRGDQFRAGLFLRTSVIIPIVPGIVTLTEVGGGLFINPTANDLLLVKTVAKMNGPSSDRVGMPPAGAFAVMLYAGFEVGGTAGASAAAGRALVTITDKAFQINAMATFFKMNDQLSGDLALQVGWDPSAYVRGDVSLLVDIDSVVTGVASVQFFAGSNLFAVKGNVDLVILGTINAWAEVIVVPSGFTAALGFSVNASTSIVSVGLSSTMRIWYRPSTDDLGAYVKLEGQVTALGVTAAIGLVGALVIEPEFAVYAQGYAKIVGIDVLTLEVWVQYTTAGFDAGLGKNEELVAVLARAEQVAADLEREANRILAGIDEAAMERARTPIAVSDASLVAAYQNFQRWNWLQLAVLWGGYRLGESGLRGGLVAQSASDPYVSFYERILSSTEAAADTALVRQLREEALQKVAVINDRRAAVTERIQALRLELATAEQAAQFVPPVDPVLQWSSGSPSFVPGPVAPDGRTIMVLAGAPTFELDDQLAEDARSTMSAAQAATAARAGQLQAQLASVEAGLTTVMAATTGSDPASFASYARVHSDAVEAIEHQHAANVDFRMRRRTWAQGKLDTLATQRAPLVQRLNDRLQAIIDFQESNSTTEWVRRRGTAVELDSLASHRSRFLSAWAQDPSISATYQAAAVDYRAKVVAAAGELRNDPNDADAAGRMEEAVTWFTTQAVNYGLQDWWGVANSGLTVSRDGAQQLVDSANAQARPVIRAMRDMHARITTDLNDLNARQAELTGVLYDLYDGYLRTYGSADSLGQRYLARKAQLAELLQAPRVVDPRVVVTDFGYLSSIQTTWSGAHPRGVYEYLLQEGADSLMTIGAQGQVRRWQYTTDPAGGSSAQNQRVVVRGGAGFTGSQTTPYTVTFRRGSANSPSTTVATVPTDITPSTRPVVSYVDLRTLTDAVGSVYYWTSDTSRLVARWNASDAESGIAEYEYRVVSWPLPEVRTYTLFGETSTTILRVDRSAIVEHLGWTSAGGRTMVAIQGLNLPADRSIGVEVRARNGAGLVSMAGVSPALRVDRTRPAFATGATTAPYLTVYSGFLSMGTFTVAGYTPPLLPTCGTVQTFTRGAEAKVWDGKLVTVTPTAGVTGGGATYTLTMTRPDATDPETGIGGYLYRVDTIAPTGVLPADGWFDILETGSTFTARAPNMVYGKPRWISLVAINQTGRLSVPLTYGPYTQADGSAPSVPGFCGDFSGGFISYLTTASADAETGLRGYQMRVRGPTGAVVRDFPTGGTVDWPASQAAVGTGFRLPIAPSVGGWHTVDLRAVNGAGAASTVASSGQVMVDLTAPSPAGVVARAGKGGISLALTIANDNESGIVGVDVALASGPVDQISFSRYSTSTLYTPYTTFSTFAGSSTVTVPVSLDVMQNIPLYVLVRVRNGAGLVSTITAVRYQ